MGQWPHMIALFALGLVLVGCPDPIPPPTDADPPMSAARVSFPAGSSVDLVDGQVLPVSTVDVRIHLEVNEPGTIQYTLDDTIPAPSNPQTGVGYAPVSLSVQDDVVVRWYATDRSGNREGKVQRVEIRFDRTAPEVRFSPPGGRYGGAFEVEVSTDEPAMLYWTLDGRIPLAGSSTVFTAPAPAIIRPSGAVTLRVLAEDAAGNTQEAPPQMYDVDDVPPRTTAVPQGGHFLAPVAVDLISDDPDSVIHYTSTGEDPDLDAPIWEGPMRIETPVELRFRGVDPYGNLEPVRYAFFEIGRRPIRAPMVSAEDDTVSMSGALRLGAAMLRASGPLSGMPDWRSSGVDWELWAAGREAVDALSLYAGVGPHVMRSPGVVEISAAGEGVPDSGLDGFNLDETWAARVSALAAKVGVSAPAGLFPVSLPYASAVATLSGAPAVTIGPDGAPAWTQRLESVRWIEGDGQAGRVTPDTLAAALSAAVARAWSGTEGRHLIGEGPWSGGAGPVVGRRCAGCHGSDGVAPILTEPAELAAVGLGDGDALSVWLRGQGGHPTTAATAVEIELATRWRGGPDGPESVYGVGREGRDALNALVGLDQAAFALHHAWDGLVFDATPGRLGAGEGADDGYLCGAVTALEGSRSNEIPPHVQQLSVEDRAFSLGPQVRLLEALIDYLEFTDARPMLFSEGPLAGSPAMPNGRALATRLAGFQVDNIGRRLTEDGFLFDSWHPDAGRERTVSTRDFADGLVALRRAQSAGYATPISEGVLATAFGLLEMYLLTSEGDYGTRLSAAFGVEPGPKRLEVQLAVLRALLIDAVNGGGPSREAAAQALWSRLEALWWDDDVGLWQSTLGLVDYRYSSDLFARALDGARLAAAAGLPNADARLRRVAEALLAHGRLGETWLGGEVAGDGDADGDGVPHFGTVGRPPIPVDEVVF